MKSMNLILALRWPAESVFGAVTDVAIQTDPKHFTS